MDIKNAYAAMQEAVKRNGELRNMFGGFHGKLKDSLADAQVNSISEIDRTDSFTIEALGCKATFRYSIAKGETGHRGRVSAVVWRIGEDSVQTPIYMSAFNFDGTGMTDVSIDDGDVELLQAPHAVYLVQKVFLEALGFLGK